MNLFALGCLIVLIVYVMNQSNQDNPRTPTGCRCHHDPYPNRWEDSSELGGHEQPNQYEIDTYQPITEGDRTR